MVLYEHISRCSFSTSSYIYVHSKQSPSRNLLTVASSYINVLLLIITYIDDCYSLTDKIKEVAGNAQEESMEPKAKHLQT